MQLSEAVAALEQIAPTRYAESWDNVGLLVGDPEQAVSRALLTIDYTPDVAAEAAQLQCDLVIAYHPPIFDALKRVTAGSLIYDAIRRGVGIYSPHTALDVAPGGTNDMLADAVGMTDRRPLRPTEPKATHVKLVTFVPEKEVEAVSTALFDAGAGWIGNYSSCSFQVRGTGTFFGEAGTSPAVGSAGKLERAEEVRLEMVVPVGSIPAAVAALKRAHPYEEPAFDLNVLAPPPHALGMGRIGAVAGVGRLELLDRIKQALDVKQLLVAGPTQGNMNRVAVCAGACGNLLNDAISENADLYLTGEMRHHDALKAAGAGITVVCTLHSNSERAVLKRLAEKLRQALPRLAVSVSRRDRDPFEVV